MLHGATREMGVQTCLHDATREMVGYIHVAWRYKGDGGVHACCMMLQRRWWGTCCIVYSCYK